MTTVFDDEELYDSEDYEEGERPAIKRVVQSQSVVKTPEEMCSENVRQLSDFSSLLDSISSTEDKQKSLWKQIYENAVTDRLNSYLIWSELYQAVRGKPSEHAINGQNLSRYIERMSKANDQLLKLAELVGAAKKKDSPEVTEEDIYNELESH